MEISKVQTRELYNVHVLINRIKKYQLMVNPVSSIPLCFSLILTSLFLGKSQDPYHRKAKDFIISKYKNIKYIFIVLEHNCSEESMVAPITLCLKN